MGIEWLEQVVQRLTSGGFRAQSGYPGDRAMHLTDTALAVNLTGMNAETATVTVTVLEPRSRGLAQCQAQAAAALDALAADGEQWSFSGWQYEEKPDCYRVDVIGTRSLGTETSKGGRRVLIGEEIQENVTDFLAKQSADRRLIRPHGQAEPIGVTPGMDGWTIQLTQLIPPGESEPTEVEEPFTLTVIRGGWSRVYQKCYWSEYTSRQMESGTQVVRSGFALSREVSANG